jgi:hypothetical protein
MAFSECQSYSGHRIRPLLLSSPFPIHFDFVRSLLVLLLLLHEKSTSRHSYTPIPAFPAPLRQRLDAGILQLFRQYPVLRSFVRANRWIWYDRDLFDFSDTSDDIGFTDGCTLTNRFLLTGGVFSGEYPSNFRLCPTYSRLRSASQLAAGSSAFAISWSFHFS